MINKRLIMHIDERKKQDMEGLKKSFISAYKEVDIEQKGTHWQITCREDFVKGIISLVERYGYWISEIQNIEEPTVP